MKSKPFLPTHPVPILFIAGMMLAGCASLARTPAPDIYDFAPPAAFQTLKARSNAQLLIPEPKALEALASAYIAVRPDHVRYAYYPNASWSDALPALLQTKLVQAFENARTMRAVGRPGESLAIDYQLLVDIRAFEVDMTGPRHAVVTLGVKLLNDRNGTVRAMRVFTATAPLNHDDAQSAVAALGIASREAIHDIVLWTATTL